MSTTKRYTITAALPYANGPVHIGHIAGCYLPADIYVRYLRLKGNDVLFICGSDEHGVPITITARKENTTPQLVVDKYHAMMKKSFDDFGISFTYYGRTSSKTHHETAQSFFKKLFDKGMLHEKQTKQYFDPEAKQFLADRYIIGTCPICGNENAYGDQCERCGTALSPEELKNPKSTLSGATPIKKLTSNWFLPLDELQPDIEKYIAEHENWKPNVLGQCKSWLQTGEGLQPRSMTRDLDWGIPVPLDNAKGKVLYVWFDAPIGYISNTIEYFEKNNKPEDWKKYWLKQEDESKNSKLIHFIGKDNIVFHCIIFPAMLMQHGDFITAENVPANEFLNLEGDKISTSRNHAVWLHEYLEDFPNRKDELRYVLTSIAPETKDADFTWKDYQQKVNSELVAILGNFVNRVMVLTWKYFDGKVPSEKEITSTTEKRISILKSYEKVHHELNISIKDMINALNDFKFREAQFHLMNLARIGNKFLQETEPWKLAKEDMEAVAAILNYSLSIVGNIAIACEPFLPETAKNITHQLNTESLAEKNKSFWQQEAMINAVPAFHQLNEAALLFKNIEDEEIEKQVAKLKQQQQSDNKENKLKTENTSSQIAEIQYDDFAKLDLRLGKIIAAEKVEKADKLLKLTVDLGYEQRTIVSGIALHFKPEDIIGKQVSVVANLAPRKLKGIESKGMILMAENKEGALQFINADSDFELGSKIS